MYRRLISALAALALLVPVTALAWLPHGNPNSIPVPPPTPTLSAQSAIAMGWSDARGTVTTDTAGGTLYSIVQLASTPNPSATQIKACQDGNGASVTQCENRTPSSGVNGPIKLGCTQSSLGTGCTTALTSATAYKIWQVQHVTAGDSNVVSAAFKTDGKLTISPQFWASNPAGHNWADNPSATQATAVVNNLLAYIQANYSLAAGDQTQQIFFQYGWDESNSPIGCNASSQYAATSLSYTGTGGVRDLLQNRPNKNSIQVATFGAMPATDPTGYGNTYFQNPMGQCAIETSACGSFNVGLVNFCAQSWDYTVDGTANPTGFVTFWGVGHHEVTEVMGRANPLSFTGTAAIADGIEDYVSAGVRAVVANWGNNGPRYPSSNGGTSSIYGGTSGFYNGPNCPAGFDDCQDLDGSVASAFNAIGGGGGINNPPLAGDFKNITRLGYGMSEYAATLGGF